jgi:hypothetical protein
MTDKDTIPQVFGDNFQWATEHSTELHQQYENVWEAWVAEVFLQTHLGMRRYHKNEKRYKFPQFMLFALDFAEYYQTSS